jgi:hypothetical protein
MRWDALELARRPEIEYPGVMGTREKHPITFTCEYCGQTVTEPHGPGQLPHYCAACYVAAQRSLNRQRVQAHRRRQAEADPYGTARQAKRRKAPGTP